MYVHFVLILHAAATFIFQVLFFLVQNVDLRVLQAFGERMFSCRSKTTAEHQIKKDLTCNEVSVCQEIGTGDEHVNSIIHELNFTTNMTTEVFNSFVKNFQ